MGILEDFLVRACQADPPSGPVAADPPVSLADGIALTRRVTLAARAKGRLCFHPPAMAVTGRTAQGLLVSVACVGCDRWVHVLVLND